MTLCAITLFSLYTLVIYLTKGGVYFFTTNANVPLIVSGSLLLESKIQPDTAYQKQQETLIVWSEGDNYDLALSFQEKAGCDEIWEKICQVGRRRFCL